MIANIFITSLVYLGPIHFICDTHIHTIALILYLEGALFMRYVVVTAIKCQKKKKNKVSPRLGNIGNRKK